MSDQRKKDLLKVAEEHLKTQAGQFQILTQKAQQSITIATSIVALVVAFNFPLQGDSQRRLIYSAFVIYGASVLLYLWSVVPRGVAGYPLEPTKKNLEEWANEADDAKFDSHLLGAFIACYEQNKKLLEHKAWLVRCMVVLMFFEIAGVILAKAVG